MAFKMQNSAYNEKIRTARGYFLVASCFISPLFKINTITMLMLFSHLGFCRLTPHPRSPGTWTIYFEGADYESHMSHENADLVSIESGNDSKDCYLGKLRCSV